LEGILNEHIFSKFPGIDYLAKHAGFSETKLKYLFKTVHNKTLLEYFQEIQMRAAYEMLCNSDVKISDVAQKFGYSNAGKFTARFKQQMNILPSEVNPK
jgi:AraC-like DNA-binding protein